MACQGFSFFLRLAPVHSRTRRNLPSHISSNDVLRNVALTASLTMSHSGKQPLVHTALVLANIIFGLGSIIGALGLPATNPLAFTFERELVAGILLHILSFLVGSTSPLKRSPVTGTADDEYLLIPKTRHWKSFATLGFCLFANQAGYICGLILAGPVTGSIWQPSAPIFTAAISMLIGLERKSSLRVTGVLLAFVGCTVMILISYQDRQAHFDDDDDGSDEDEDGPLISMFLVGNVLFFINCLSAAGYILFSKDVLYLYPSLTVTAWSYLIAAPCMCLAAILSSTIPAAEKVICPSCVHSDTSIFRIPSSALPALTYYIVAMSVGSWGCIIWANQYATGTLVIGYSVLQPITSLISAGIVVLLGWVASCKDVGHHRRPCLYEPGIGTFAGMLGVFLGLSIIIKTEATHAPLSQGDGTRSKKAYGTLSQSNEAEQTTNKLPPSPTLA
jgi:drug/metabolite transporter (DMT)-like permease